MVNITRGVRSLERSLQDQKSGGTTKPKPLEQKLKTNTRDTEDPRRRHTNGTPIVIRGRPQPTRKVVRFPSVTFIKQSGRPVTVFELKTGSSCTRVRTLPSRAGGNSVNGGEVALPPARKRTGLLSSDKPFYGAFIKHS